ncbi:MAG: hypothetical protein U5N56_01715 [Candidatus Marinimicrobia bacterium]|nr:hypothetical protein [Candidatus Neomarinimicrobiota bacterium]
MGSPTTGEVPLTVNFIDLSTCNTQMVTAAAGGYINYSNSQVQITAYQENILNIALSPEITEGEMRFVLTWDDDPADLDSHIKTPPIEGNTYHVYYSSKGDSVNAPYVTLDVDDVTGYGPETITIYESFSGTYYYYIYKYSGYEEIIQSNAVLNIYGETGLLQTLQVPTSGTGRYWNICTIDGDTQVITYINRIQEIDPGDPDIAASGIKSSRYLQERAGSAGDIVCMAVGFR